MRPLPKRLQPSTWLIGTWRSDKEKTIRRWNRGAPSPSSNSRRAFVESGLGKIINRYTGKRWHHTYEDSGFCLPYRVVWQDGSSLFIVYTNGRSESGELIHFISKSTFYLLRGGYAEFFTKDDGRQ